MFARFIQIWDKCEYALAGFLMAVALGICFLEVISRYVVGHSYYWAKECILYSIIWSTFLGASHILKKEKHIKLSFVVDLLPAKARKIVNIVTTCIGLVFCMFLTVSGCRLVEHAYVAGVTSTSLAKTPLWIPYLIMPLAGLLYTMRFVELLAGMLAKPAKNQAFEARCCERRSG